MFEALGDYAFEMIPAQNGGQTDPSWNAYAEGTDAGIKSVKLSQGDQEEIKQEILYIEKTIPDFKKQIESMLEEYVHNQQSDSIIQIWEESNRN